MCGYLCILVFMDNKTVMSVILTIIVIVASLFFIQLLLPVVFVYALYISYRYLPSKKWFGVLLACVLTSMTIFVAHIYMGSKTNCGTKYNVDTGCSTVLPSWTITLAIVAFVLSVLLSIIIVALNGKTKDQSKTDHMCCI